MDIYFVAASNPRTSSGHCWKEYLIQGTRSQIVNGKLSMIIHMEVNNNLRTELIKPASCFLTELKLPANPSRCLLAKHRGEM